MVNKKNRFSSELIFSGSHNSAGVLTRVYNNCLADMYCAEKNGVEIFPSITECISDTKTQQLFDSYYYLSLNRLSTIEEVCHANLNDPDYTASVLCLGFIKHAAKTAEECKDDYAPFCKSILTLQRHKLVNYQSLYSTARMLSFTKAVPMFKHIVATEKEAVHAFTKAISKPRNIIMYSIF